MTGTINLGDEWEITADETVDDLVIRHKPTANSFALGADGTFTPLPELAITSVTTVPDKAARLSVSAEEGDIVIQTDVSKTFVLTTNDPTVNSNWVEIQIDVLNTIDGQQITPSQVGTSSNRTDVVANTVDANNVTGDTNVANRQGCRVFLSSNQSINTTSAVKIQFDSVEYDSNNNFDTAANEWVCPENGLYAVKLQVRFTGGASGQTRRVIIGNSGSAFPTAQGADNTSQSSNSGLIASATSINQYKQSNRIAGYARNPTGNDIINSGNNAVETHLEVAFLGGL